MEERQREMEAHQKRKEEHAAKYKELQEKLAAAEKSGDATLEELKQKLKVLEVEAEEIRKKDEDIKKKEKVTPWNVDTISKPGFAKTVINKKTPRQKEEQLSEEEREQRMKKFIKENEKDLKHFGMLRRYEDSRQFLKSHDKLVCENTANYLVIWCINLEMEEVIQLFYLILLNAILYFLMLVVLLPTVKHDITSKYNKGRVARL